MIIGRIKNKMKNKQEVIMKKRAVLFRPIKELLLQFLIIGITIFCMFTTFKYSDFEMMTVWSIDFWDLLFEGRLLEFYPYTSLRIRMREELVAVCTGNYLWLIPWAIWNLPVWIFHKVTGTIKVTGFFSLMWSKLFLIMLTFVTIYYLCKIVESMKGSKEYNKLIGLLVLASPEMFNVYVLCRAR